MTDNVIKNPVPKNFQNNTKAIADVKNGVIGTGTIAQKNIKNNTEKEVKVKAEYEKVAIFSSKSVSLPGVGKVSKGYNIIPKNTLDKWLERDHVREATPQERAEEFGL